MSDLQVVDLTIERAPRSGINLTVPSGTMTALLGPSGSGKSTLLQTIVGALPAPEGTIHVGDQDVTHLPTYRRGIGIVFQEPLLFTNMDVAKNIGYGLRNLPAARRADRVAELLEWTELTDFGHTPVTELSGGQAQRVALARALAPKPGVLLLDEPFSALDRDLRTRLGSEVHDAIRNEGVAAMYVTHDPEEAEAIADQVVTITNLGRLSPRRIDDA
jgi:ABC-type sulfate/molybdate transport systems ATPase subunit